MNGGSDAWGAIEQVRQLADRVHAEGCVHLPAIREQIAEVKAMVYKEVDLLRENIEKLRNEIKNLSNIGIGILVAVILLMFEVWILRTPPTIIPSIGG